MTALLALLPCIAVVVAVIVFRRSGLIASVIALILAAILWLAGVFSPPALDHLLQAVIDTALLQLLVGLIIFFGLLFVEVSGEGSGFAKLIDAIQQLRLSPVRVILCVTIGIGVTVESLTGYGVSLLVTVPLLIELVSRRQAIWLALIGMSLMAWGALSVAALLGAEMARLPIGVMAWHVLLTSGPVAFLLPIACIWVAGERRPIAYLHGISTSVLFVVAIALTTYFVGIELAGVGGGLAVLGFILLGANDRRRIRDIYRNPSFQAYGLLIACLLLQKLLVWTAKYFGFDLILRSETVTFDLFATPALALITAATIWQWYRVPTAPLKALTRSLGNTLKRAWRPLLTIAVFLFTARLLVESSAITALSDLMAQVGGYPAVAAVVILGAVGAYATGSGVTANALFMPAAASTGAAMQALPLFAALQHSGAAHAAMASLPILALLIAALPKQTADDAPMAARAGLSLAGIWISCVILVGWILL